MGEFNTIFIVSAFLWTMFIAYATYLHRKLQMLESRIK